MNEIYVKARAKINLNLEILDKRDDGYHNLKSVFQKVNLFEGFTQEDLNDLYDELYIKKTDKDEFELQTNIDCLNNNQNIIYKAYIKMKQKYKSITGVKVVLNKKIPMQAGLGGGSTDCASFILCMNKLFNLGLSRTEMENIAQSLGADVTPCLYNGAVFAQEIGNKITTINTNFKYYIVIIKPKISCDTKEMYNKLDKRNKEDNVNKSEKIIKALVDNDIYSVANNLYNSFETVIDDNIIIKIKNELIENKAIGSLMTGSGSCVYGIFENKEIAKQAYNNLKNKYQTYICTSYNLKLEE